MAPVSMTLSDLDPDFKLTILFKVKKKSKMVQDRAIFAMADQ